MQRVLDGVLSFGVLASLLGSVMLAPTSAAFAQDAQTATCDVADGEAAVMVKVERIRMVEGNLRAQVYSNDPDEFLASGKKLVRVDVPVVTDGEQEVCVKLPAPGSYALVVMHDRNANGKADFFTEGFGFGRNPELALAPPDHDEVVMSFPAGVTKTDVRLKYLFGEDSEAKEKRRRLKRR